MIRIETIAEFDADGRFTLTGQSTEAVVPGSHHVVVLVDDPSPSSEEADALDPALKRINGILVYTGQILEDPEKVRQRLDEERMQLLLGPSLWPTVVEENGLLLLNAVPEEEASVNIQSLIDADREERMNHIVGGGKS